MSYPLDADATALIFSDLDATLLDHYSYSFAAAKSTLDKLRLKAIPVILNTSKTLAEVKVIRAELQLTSPFIVENGAAIFIPQDFFKTKPKEAVWQDGFWVKTFASRRSHWLNLIKKLQPEFLGQFEMFSEMSLARISEVTGLSETNAALAAQRLYGEPLLWNGNDDERDIFVAKAKKMGACALLGGRFLHICSDANKGKALTWMKNEYQRQLQQTNVKTIALGDSNNDIAMLEVADIAVRIRSPIHPPPLLQRKDSTYTSSLTGPDGWREAIELIMPSL
ncbi:HAD-IIB family hydrolase [Glaciecola sp. SC05]|uniref:HAD-IIB family hydrolase n=1 Tax=Glaciecola sp. SC05 TaxID=1987355 RepID=UPI003527321A